MKITVALLVLAAAHAADVRSPAAGELKEAAAAAAAGAGAGRQTDKRALAEGNVALEKRAPVIPTASPSLTPGIEYAVAPSKAPAPPRDKSAAQHIYATAAPPRVAKISDVVSVAGHEQAYAQLHAAIAGHLYSPVPVYRARLSSPTTYEVSAPVASQLAYSENISYQPQRVQYTPQVRQYNQLSPQLAFRNQQASKQATFARLPEQIIIQQPLYSQPQIVQYQPQLSYQNQPIYTQAPRVVYDQNQVQPYAQQLVAPEQPGIVYARQEVSADLARQQPAQRELKIQAEPANISGKQKFTPEQNYNQQQQRPSEHSQGAVSYASFSQSQPAAPVQPQHRQQPLFRYQLQPQPQPQPQAHLQHESQPQSQYQLQSQEQQAQPQTQYQTQTQQQSHYQPEPQQYQPQSQPQYQSQSQDRSQDRAQNQPQYQIQLQPQYQTQSQHQAETQSQYQTQVQPQYLQPQPQYVSHKSAPAPADSIEAPARPAAALIGPAQYFRAALVPAPQVYPAQQVLVPSPAAAYGGGAQPIAVAPTFAPVQYFGKFAQSIFGTYQR